MLDESYWIHSHGWWTSQKNKTQKPLFTKTDVQPGGGQFGLLKYYTKTEEEPHSPYFRPSSAEGRNLPWKHWREGGKAGTSPSDICPTSPCKLHVSNSNVNKVPRVHVSPASGFLPKSLDGKGVDKNSHLIRVSKIVLNVNCIEMC